MDLQENKPGGHAINAYHDLVKAGLLVHVEFNPLPKSIVEDTHMPSFMGFGLEPKMLSPLKKDILPAPLSLHHPDITPILHILRPSLWAW